MRQTGKAGTRGPRRAMPAAYDAGQPEPPHLADAAVRARLTPAAVDAMVRLAAIWRLSGVEVCALLTKPERRRVENPIRYVGFEIPNRFAIGYGLDLDEKFRNLSYVAALDDSAGSDDASRSS